MPDRAITKALSLRAPAWWEILYAGKDNENRTWSTDYRGTVYLHASRQWISPDYKQDFDRDLLREIEDLAGHIVGTVEIVDCVREHTSSWHQPGYWGFILANPQPLVAPFKYRGALGLFNV